MLTPKITLIHSHIKRLYYRANYTTIPKFTKTRGKYKIDARWM